MKFFETPAIEVVKFAVEDVVTTSTPQCPTDMGEEEM